jgi:hypothetical protein
MLNILLKILLGIASVLIPITFIVMFIVVGPGNSGTNIYLGILVIAAIISYPSVLIIYVIHVYRSKGISKEQKNLWAALLFFGNIIIYPVYWYLYIWRKPKMPTEIK